MSTLTVSNISDATTTVGTSYVVNGSAKAWVNFNGTGTIAVQNSLNVTSLTDNGTGSYTVNTTSSFSAADFVVSVTSSGRNYTNLQLGSEMTSSSFRTDIDDSSLADVDRDYVLCTAHGDLA